MKVTLFMAQSLNGIIARENYSEDFLSDENWITFIDLLKEKGCLIWGRKTYEIVKVPDNYQEDFGGIRKVIVTGNETIQLKEGFISANSPKAALDLLKKEGFVDVILSGGSALNSSYAKEGLIDEVILNIEPVIIGRGIPIFKTEDFDLNLSLINSKKVFENIIQLHYQVLK